MTGQLLLVCLLMYILEVLAFMQVLPLSRVQLSSLQNPTPKDTPKSHSTSKPDSTPGLSTCQITKPLTWLYIHCCILFIAVYWFYFPVSSGFKCAKSKVPNLTVHSFLHTAHSYVIVIWAINYVATQVLENTLTLTLCINQYWLTHSRRAEFSLILWTLISATLVLNFKVKVK